MENITYVTGNYGKYISVRNKFLKEGIDIYYYKMDLEEPNVNDINIISRYKAMEAYEVLKSPVFVADSGFYIEDYPNKPGYPGVFVKRSGISSDIDNLLSIMKNVKNRNCMFLDCLTYYDGEEFKSFYGCSKGVLAYEKRGNYLKEALSNLWYIFIPEGYDKTLAEMSEEERLSRKNQSATKEFISWYKNNNKKNELRLIK